MLSLLAAAVVAGLRPPSVPLVVQDPYSSFWLPADSLADASPQRWDGWSLAWSGMVKVDNGTCYGWMASSAPCKPANQTGLTVTATKTFYLFNLEDKVEFTVSFRTPSAIEETPDYKMMTLPMSYLDFAVKSLDGNSHNVAIYFDVTGEAGVTNPYTDVIWGRAASDTNAYLTIGNTEQTFNSAQGSDSINWGYLNIGYDPNIGGVQTSIGVNYPDARDGFTKLQMPPDAPLNPRGCNNGPPVNAVLQTVTVQANQVVMRHMTVGFDQGDTYINYFGTNFGAYWKHVHGDYLSALDYAANNHDEINGRCDDFDEKVTSELTDAGNSNYAEMGSLVYRQVTGGMVTVWNHITNEPWVFMKEISSDGDVSTVDVIYPAAPMILYYSPEMFRKLLLPIMVYANNGTAAYGLDVKYNLAWAPHHLGHWPVCDLTPKKQEQMPVEETGNILILINYIAQQQQDITWLEPFWDVVHTWGGYLPTALPDPGNQLCTDDFEGPSPHNVNLAIKGIVGIAAYSQLLSMKGDPAGAAQAMTTAKNYAKYWVKNGTDTNTTNGVHTKLQYNLTSSWSQKYNIFWDQLFDFGLVPDTLLMQELAFYMTEMNEYGVPLDDRATFTKLDWSMWIAAMAPKQQFTTMSDTVYKWINECTNRVPVSDWTETTSPKVHGGFKARPVVGGFWAKMLLEKKKAASKRPAQ